MEYSAQELARLSGVSVRTLRHYSEIGLLIPKIRMVNGRCYYGVKEVIYLTQILSLKEFGFSLHKIKSLLKDNPVCKISKLVAQKLILTKELEHLKTNLQVIESMIKYYNENNMTDITPELIEANFEKFRSKTEYAKYYDEAALQEYAKQSKGAFRLRVGEEYYECYLKKTGQQDAMIAAQYGHQYGVFLKNLIESFAKGLAEDSSVVQNLIREQWKTLKMIYPDTDSQTIYLAIRDQLSFSPIQDEQAQSFLDYLSKAMTIYSEHHFR